MTNPTPEQAEAAGVAYEDHGKHTRYYDNRVCTERDEYFEGRAAFEAHRWAAALVAAAGAAPSSELLCPLHHDGDSSTRNRANERTDNNLVDESPDRQTCNKPGNDGHDHFRSVHNAQRSNGADSSTPGVTPQDNGNCGGCRGLGPHRNVPNCDFYEPPVAVDEAKLTVAVPAVPYGPAGVPADRANAGYYRSAAKNIRYHASRGRMLTGSNLTETVARLCDATADALYKRQRLRGGGR